MIRKLTHIAIILLLSFTAIAQKQEIFLQILSLSENSDSITLLNSILQNENTLKEDVKLSKALAFELDKKECAYASFTIASLHQNESWSKYFLAREASLNGEYKKAANLLSAHMQNNKRRMRSEIRSCKDFSDMQNSAYWDELWRNSYYRDQDFQYESAVNYFNNLEYNWALEEINQLLLQYPDNSNYLKLRAKIYISLDQNFLALKDIENSIRSNNRDSEAHLIAAQLYTQNQRYNKAEEALTNAEKIDPYSQNLLRTKIILLSETKNYHKVIENAKNYNKYFTDIEILYLLAVAQNHTGQFTDAIIVMNKVLQENTSEAKYFTSRADAFMATRSWANAMKDYAMALDIDPTLAEVYLNYGICRHENGDTEGACYLWKKALHYKSTEAAELLYRYCK